MNGRAVALAVALCAAAGCSGRDRPAPSAPSDPPVESATVSIRGLAFGPQAIVVSAGATVTFDNEDGTAHDVTFPTGGVKSVGRFSTGSRDVTMPMTPGTYEYQCTIHPNMRGSIQVE